MSPGNIFQARPRLMKFVLFLVSLAISGAAFITLDYYYSAAILKTTGQNVALQNRGPTVSENEVRNCNTPDPVLHHAFKPNCAGFKSWGRDSYDIFTNSLGFRDERIRKVPLADARPRLLLLGDSYTEGMIAWRDSYAGRIAAHFLQYDFLNGGGASYSPSIYLNVARKVLGAGVEFDEAIVFIDMSDTQDEAAFYRDTSASGAVAGPLQGRRVATWYSDLRPRITRRLVLANYLLEFFERNLIRHGYYHLAFDQGGNVFDLERSAWTYRQVSDTDPGPAGYAPLGVEGGIAKEKAKMTLLWQELGKRHIPVSVVVYPWPAQLAHDTADSRQVRIWRDWCEGKCKRFISLFPVFFAVRDQCSSSAPGCWYSRFFIFGDIHYNSRGNALVADAVIKSLEEVPPAKASARGDDTLPSKGREP
jgi:hypothetical protein